MIDAVDKGEWKVKIERAVFMDRIDFYVWKRVGDGSAIVQPDSLMRKVKDGEYMDNILPSFSLQGYESRQMMHALAEALAEEGIKTPNDHVLKGQLEAQSAHLKDLRALLKLK